jgi:hypothetical protein
MKSKLNKIIKLNSQTNLILRSKIEKQITKKLESTSWAYWIHDLGHDFMITPYKKKLKQNKKYQFPTNLILSYKIKKNKFLKGS